MTTRPGPVGRLRMELQVIPANARPFRALRKPTTTVRGKYYLGKNGRR